MTNPSSMSETRKDKAMQSSENTENKLPYVYPLLIVILESNIVQGESFYSIRDLDEEEEGEEGVGEE